jgi:hypothetical protein
VAGAAVVALASCSPGPVSVAPVSAPPAACKALLAGLPSQVGSQDARPVSPAGAGAAWGSPPVVLRCGVRRPAAMTSSASCVEVNDVGWFAEQREPGYVFTTIGRSVYVELTVPSAYAPESNALVDVADAVKTHIPAETACV